MGSAGIENLVTPFLAAGAEAVLANLWEADDTFTAMFIRTFYTHLHEERPTAAALQQTKLDIIARYGSAAPANLWAGFVLNGVSRQVFNE
jgi:CHAT domain-containing protein